MTTIIEVIHRINTIKPNNYAQAEKIKWLSSLDGIVKKDIIDKHEGGDNVKFDGYKENIDLNQELLVPAPYDDIYLFWLEAQINYWNGEIDKYDNSMEMFNQAFSNYAKYYKQTHMPKAKNFKYF